MWEAVSRDLIRHLTHQFRVSVGALQSKSPLFSDCSTYSAYIREKKIKDQIFESEFLVLLIIIQVLFYVES